MTVAQYAKLRGCSKQAVLNRIRRGTLEAKKVKSRLVSTGWYWDVKEK